MTPSDRTRFATLQEGLTTQTRSGGKNAAQGRKPWVEDGNGLSPNGAERAAVRLLGVSNRNRLVLHVCALEVGDLMASLKVPDTRGDFVNQVFVVSTQQHRPLIAL
jgi:hypothetical protein